jgi:hypothetical protein
MCLQCWHRDCSINRLARRCSRSCFPAPDVCAALSDRYHGLSLPSSPIRHDTVRDRISNIFQLSTLFFFAQYTFDCSMSRYSQTPQSLSELSANLNNFFLSLHLWSAGRIPWPEELDLDLSAELMNSNQYSK